MRVLMTNHHLWQPGGSETWTDTVSRELVRRGHDVEVLAAVPGLYAEIISCPVVVEPTGRYDLALVNQNSGMPRAASVADRVIMTCHGVYPDLEQPVPGAHRYVSVSEEVQQHLFHLGFLSEVILNPIACDIFAPVRPIRSTVRRVLSLCHGEDAMSLVQSACDRLGVEFVAIRGARSYSAPSLMNEVDLVVGLGRTAMEGMACGRAVLVLDSRDYSPAYMDGLVDRHTVDEFASSNFSGRARRIAPTEDEVVKLISSFDPSSGAANREFVLRELEVTKQVDKYLELADSIDRHALRHVRDEPDYEHLGDRELFKSMYDEVGLIDANKNVVWREEWMSPFSPERTGRILELGAHNGPNLIHYAREGHSVDGVEISDSLADTFERFAAHEPGEVRDRMRMTRGWIEDFVAEEPYDYVLCTEVLEHTPDPVEVIKVAARSVKPDGIVYISSPSILWGNNTHVRSVRVDELGVWLKEAGMYPELIWESQGRTFCFARRQLDG